jgi:hypothetical protein
MFNVNRLSLAATISLLNASWDDPRREAPLLMKASLTRGCSMKRIGFGLAVVIMLMLPTLMSGQNTAGTQNVLSSSGKSSQAVVAILPATPLDDPAMCSAGASKRCPQGQERCGDGCYDPKTSCCCASRSRTTPGGRDVVRKGTHPDCNYVCKAHVAK